MFSALLVCTACLAFDQPATVATESPGISGIQGAYLDAKSQLGRSPDDHVRLALWCKAHRMETERLKHLTIAVLKDPAHATARGLLGLVAFGGGWHSPEAIGSRSSRPTRASLRFARITTLFVREWKTRATPTGNLALWCEQQGLKPQATAHLVAVTQLDPARDAAWTHLASGANPARWVTDGQIAAEKAEADDQRKADKHWMTVLTRWRNELDDPARRGEATQALSGVFDPRAVRFGLGRLRHWKTIASEDRGPGARADRFDVVDSRALNPGRHERVRRGPKHRDPDAPHAQPARRRILARCPAARSGARWRSHSLPLFRAARWCRGDRIAGCAVRPGTALRPAQVLHRRRLAEAGFSRRPEFNAVAGLCASRIEPDKTPGHRPHRRGHSDPQRVRGSRRRRQAPRPRGGSAQRPNRRGAGRRHWQRPGQRPRSRQEMVDRRAGLRLPGPRAVSQAGLDLRRRQADLRRFGP